MNKTFHDQEFDDGTALKLSIFQGYTREWVPVFMTDSPNMGGITSVNIFDFFAGPGGDTASNPGSPLIIQQEIRKYCETHSSMKNSKPITMYFNDKESSKIESLRLRINGIQCGLGCCHPEFRTKLFSEAFEELFPVIASPGSANLVIMDQFGITDVTPEVIQRLASCSCTDILFFFPSSFMHRFREHSAFSSKLDLRGKELDYHTIHRDICECFRELMGSRKYYLAPFSIKKNSSIHGVIFGTGSLYGLEKFLNVCWKLDPETGEANYNIEGDPFRGQTNLLFPELKTYRKMDQFQADLLGEIREHQPDNLSMYPFCLKKGFPPCKANEALKTLQESGQIITIPIGDQKLRKGTFYLGHKERVSKIRFRACGEAV